MNQGLFSQETDTGAVKGEEKRCFLRQIDARETSSSNAEYSGYKEMTSEEAERGTSARLPSSVSSSSGVMRGKAPPIPQKPAFFTGVREQNIKSAALLRQSYIPSASSELHGGIETPQLESSTRPFTGSQKTLQ